MPEASDRDTAAPTSPAVSLFPRHAQPPSLPAESPTREERPARPRFAMRRTPCVGICSTTYGDLVCRGCKRFAHEIVGWNSYDERQRELVWQRLHELLAQSVRQHLRIVDEARLREVAGELAPDAQTPPLEVLAFQTLRLRPLPLAALGLAHREADTRRKEGDARDVLLAIDREFHWRSRAHYEAAFKTPTT